MSTRRKQRFGGLRLVDPGESLRFPAWELESIAALTKTVTDAMDTLANDGAVVIVQDSIEIRAENRDGMLIELSKEQTAFGNQDFLEKLLTERFGFTVHSHRANPNAPDECQLLVTF